VSLAAGGGIPYRLNPAAMHTSCFMLAQVDCLKIMFIRFLWRIARYSVTVTTFSHASCMSHGIIISRTYIEVSDKA